MTAVIPGQDAVYVLQLNAESTVDQVKTAGGCYRCHRPARDDHALIRP